MRAGGGAGRVRPGRDPGRRRDDPFLWCRAAGTGRCASGSPSVTASIPARVVLTVGGLHGFVLYVAEALAAPAGPRARRGADLRPAAEDPRPRVGAEVVALDMDDEGLDPDALEASSRAKRRPALVPLHDPDLPEPERADALARAPASASPRSPTEHGLPVLEDDPYGLVRFEGEAPPTLHRADGRRARHVHVLVLEDGRARAQNRVLRAPGRPKPRLSRSERVSTYISPPFLTQATIAEFVRARALRAEPASSSARELRERRDAMIVGARADVPRRCVVEPSRGRVLHLARARRGVETPPSSRSAARAGGVAHRAGPGLLPARLRWRQLVRAACVQLRDARANRRGRRASRDAALAVRRSSSATRTRALEEKSAGEADRDAEEDEEEQAGRTSRRRGSRP